MKPTSLQTDEFQIDTVPIANSPCTSLSIGSALDTPQEAILRKELRLSYRITEKETKEQKSKMLSGDQFHYSKMRSRSRVLGTKVQQHCILVLTIVRRVRTLARAVPTGSGSPRGRCNQRYSGAR
ncbi:hypothetical protein ACJJTC_005319 [Scirpophaga incertulas]